eukprot:3721131-Alexandrium_andersonii.AAC.1
MTGGAVPSFPPWRQLASWQTPFASSGAGLPPWGFGPSVSLRRVAQPIAPCQLECGFLQCRRRCA